MGDAGEPFDRNTFWKICNGLICGEFGKYGSFCCILFDKDAQSTEFDPALELEIDEFQIVRGGDTLRSCSNLVYLDCHKRLFPVPRACMHKRF